MHIPKKYFHDRVVLLLLSAAVFLAILSSILVFLRVDGSNSSGYIVQYRANLGVSAFKTGSAGDLYAFIGFAAVVLALHFVMSIRIYSGHRQYAVAILGMAVFLLTVGMIVSSALLLQS